MNDWTELRQVVVDADRCLLGGLEYMFRQVDSVVG